MATWARHVVQVGLVIASQATGHAAALLTLGLGVHSAAPHVPCAAKHTPPVGDVWHQPQPSGVLSRHALQLLLLAAVVAHVAGHAAVNHPLNGHVPCELEHEKLVGDVWHQPQPMMTLARQVLQLVIWSQARGQVLLYDEEAAHDAREVWHVPKRVVTWHQPQPMPLPMQLAH